jgi:hypothetical protein
MITEGLIEPHREIEEAPQRKKAKQSILDFGFETPTLNEFVTVYTITPKGEEIRSAGGWIRYKKRQRAWFIFDRIIVHYGTFVLAALAVVVPLYCSGPSNNTAPQQQEQEAEQTKGISKTDSVLTTHRKDTSKSQTDSLTRPPQPGEIPD